MSRSAVHGTLPLVLAVLAGAGPAAAAGIEIRLPSGAMVEWQETLHDNAGGTGLTYRFRFIMPDLASRLPQPGGQAADFAPEDREPIDIDTETGEVSGEADATPGDMPATPEDQDMAAGPDEEEEADAIFGEGALPDAADLGAGDDPIHADIVWLCRNWALPRVASPAPRPSQIIISIADRPLAFGTADPKALQLFEAFRLPPDRDVCEWEPW